MKKIWIFFLYPLFLFGSDSDPTEQAPQEERLSLEERVALLEQQMEQLSIDTVNRTFGANFTPSNFQRGWIGLFFQGECLYWQPKIGGTEYAYKLIGNAVGFKVDRTNNIEDLDFNWAWGGRASLGITFSGIGWEIVCTGTWYTTNLSKPKNSQLPTILLNLKDALSNPLKKNSFRYDLSYNEVLLELRRTYATSRFLYTYTSIGVKRDWVDQTQYFYYHVARNQNYRVKDNCDFEGTGPRLGLGTQWHLLWGFNFVTNIGGSLLYGKHQVKHSEKLPPMSQVCLRGNTHLFSPQVDFCLGLGWDLYAKSCHFGISLNYEALYLWRQNEALRMDDTTQSRLQVVRYADDITFYGAVLKMKIEF